ncbi:TPA: hypothetical protein VB679_001857, partial [Streptococcus pyogenes]|nr:hypothetical protein [Streptococcus pyogenes]
DVVNPYFEDTTQELWLKCTIEQKNNTLIPEFRIDFSQTSYQQELQIKISNIYTMGNTSILDRINTWGVNKFTNKLQFWIDIESVAGTQQLVQMLNSQIELDVTHSQNFYELSLYRGVINYLNTGHRLRL